MKEEYSNTKERILEYAKQEFLEKGFKNASLRNICKMAGVTTGAVYGYFKDKDSIFIELIKDVMDGIKNLIDEIEGDELEEDIFDLFATKKNRDNMVQIHNRYVDYIYDNMDAVRLIIGCSDGSSAENFIDEISKYLADIDKSRIIVLEEKGIYIEKFVLHMLINFFVTSICELIEHNIPREEALNYITKLSTFFFAGWAELLKIEKE